MLARESVLVQRELKSSVRRFEQGGDILSGVRPIVPEGFFALRKYSREERGIN